jgi:HprK-related kinase A
LPLSRLASHSLPLSEFGARLRQDSGIRLIMGPFTVQVRTGIRPLGQTLHAMYSEFPLAETEGFADFHVALDRPRTWRAWINPQVLFSLDGRNLFDPFPADTGFPLFEWGLNWCIGHQSHQYLILHAAVVERNGAALLLPAIPGSGKSTLCAALINRGWRLLSDEFGLFDFTSRRLAPLPRPVALKNESIEVIRRFAPDAVLGPLFPKTRKGTVAHLRPPKASVQRMYETVPPTFIIFPRFSLNAALTLRTVPKSQAFLRLAHNSFNYEITGADGFRAVGEIVRASQCFELSYGDLDAALSKIDSIIP